MRIDWQQIILNLKHSGMTYRAISEAIGIDAQAIGHLVRGETYEPKFSKGLALLNLHYDKCKDKHSLMRLKI